MNHMQKRLRSLLMVGGLLGLLIITPAAACG
jgi:hypothetical protein